MRLRPKNWAEFQHYKDRAPPWIKLHHKLLDDRTFQCLPDASRALAHCLWLIASEEKDGVFDGTGAEIAFRVRQPERWVESALKPLISNGFFIVVQDASNPLAECQQLAVPEAEAERETKTEKEAERRATRLPQNFEPLSEPELDARIDYQTELASFRDYWNSKGGKDAAKLDWQATWRNWIRKAGKSRVGHNGETDYQRRQREFTEAMSPRIARGRPVGESLPKEIFDGITIESRGPAD